MGAAATIAVIAVVGYLLGSINSAILVSRLTMGYDIRTKGSGNAGLTNAYRCMGGARTLAVLIGDVAKAAAALSVGGALMGPMGKLIAGAFVIVGHVFPLYFGFRGGKGVLVGATMVGMFDWRILVILLTVFGILVAVTRWVSLGSVAGAALFPVVTYLFYHDIPMLLMTAAMGGAVVYMHRSNLVRIAHGEENRFTLHGGKK
ncbi:MAG TPA: acyl-phosphate glycerol 3-phosphate acyltransferase [Clostridiales bacterium]|nr:acyl-phosphate glycerol 3-phosphate acyltransferase [Clostridiales bacterium]